MTEDASVLVRFFGDSPFIKVLDTLLDHPQLEYTKKDLAEVNDISRPTLYRIWDKIEELELVEESRKIGNTTLYSLNTESPLVAKIVRFEKEMQQDEEVTELLGLSDTGPTETEA